MKLKSTLILSVSSLVTTLAMACPDHDHAVTEGTGTQSSHQKAVVASSQWIRPAQKGQNTAAYLCTCLEGLGDSDELLGVQSDVADTIELHDHIDDNGIMKMRPVSSIVIEKDKTVMKPGGKHIMLFGLKKELKKGEKVSMNLTFKKAGVKQIEFTVDQPKV